MVRVPSRPFEPLVVVLGSTGTGKSDLAVELACRFNGEIINADAMQMYRGLPVTTNKISTEEQRGIPHHLLGTIGLDEPTWKVGRFRHEAARTIEAIRNRGRLPIVVGGTHYYTDGLLFDDHLVDAPSEADAEDEEGLETINGDGNDDNGIRYPILNGPTEAMLAQLKEVDPVMADRWHPNDGRKIRRSLEIYLTTGRRASDIYAEQRRRKEKKELQKATAKTAGGGDHDVTSGTGHHKTPWQYLLFWVYAKPDVLNARLDARIDTMLERGLMEETSAMYDTLQDYLRRGVPVDRCKGIWQSIGFKEMEPYWAAVAAAKDSQQAAGSNVEADSAASEEVAAQLAKLRAAGLDGIKFGTRRYARSQLRWIRHKTIPLLSTDHALDRLFLLDSTDKTRFQENVAETGARLTAAFLEQGSNSLESGGGLPQPVDVSDTAREVLTATIAASKASTTSTTTSSGDGSGTSAARQTCEVCRTSLLAGREWDLHIRGQRHRRAVQRQKRRALMPVQGKPTALVAAPLSLDQESGASAEASLPDSPSAAEKDDALDISQHQP